MKVQFLKLWILITLVISQEVLSNTLSKEKGLQEKNNEPKAEKLKRSATDSEVKKIYGFMYDSLKTEKDAISQQIDHNLPFH